MNKYFLFTLYSLLQSIFCVFSQQCPKIFIEPQYKKQYYASGSDELSQNYVFIGMYKESLKEEEKFETVNFIGKSNRFPNAKAKNAYPYIYDAIRKNDIVLLNECHNMPSHRVTFYSILDSLKSLGVNSIFMETLPYIENDSSYFASEDISDWSYSGRENVFRQILKKIQRLSLELYSYEKSFASFDTISKDHKKYMVTKKYNSWIPIEVDDYVISAYFNGDTYKREVEQALKIAQKLKKNHIQKTVIYCGYSHLWKGGNHMADILQHILHKKVFSIDQVELNERVDKKYEDPVYTTFANPQHPFVLFNSEECMHQIYFPKENRVVDTLVDMTVGAVQTRYLNNRPNWLELNGDRRRYALSSFIDVEKYNTDFLVAIYDLAEFDKKLIEPIPEDVFQVENNAKEYDIVVSPQKKYRLIVTKDMVRIIDKIIEVK